VILPLLSPDGAKKRIIPRSMRRDWKFVAARWTMWSLALVVAFVAARYFLSPVPWLYRMQVLALTRHPFWLRLHIAGGIVTLTLGLFQFMASLRAVHPLLHRNLGRLYVAAVLVGGIAGLRLTPDTRVFVADALNEGKAFDLSPLSPSFLGYGPSSTYSPSQFFLVMLGFGTLAVAWLFTTTAALVRARQRQFDQHQRWMTRSYSLTFAAVTVRFVGLPFLVLTRDPVVAITCTFWSWLLNLAVAEWLLRRQHARLAQRTVIASP